MDEKLLVFKWQQEQNYFSWRVEGNKALLVSWWVVCGFWRSINLPKKWLIQASSEYLYNKSCLFVVMNKPIYCIWWVERLTIATLFLLKYCKTIMKKTLLLSLSNDKKAMFTLYFKQRAVITSCCCNIKGDKQHYILFCYWFCPVTQFFSCKTWVLARTYYFSPFNINPFVVVNVFMNPTRMLTKFVILEGTVDWWTVKTLLEIEVSLLLVNYEY
jgi:hypothetical protein